MTVGRLRENRCRCWLVALAGACLVLAACGDAADGEATGRRPTVSASSLGDGPTETASPWSPTPRPTTPSDPSEPSSRTEPTDRTSTATPTERTTKPDPDDDDQARQVGWLPFGPATPLSPSATARVYAHLRADCARAVTEPRNENMSGDAAAFWEAAAHACLAFRTSSDTEWEAATAAWTGGGRSYGAHDCLVDQVRVTLQSIMGPAAAPTSRPSITLVGAPTAYACPPSDLALSPQAGPPGTEVELSWVGAPWMGTSGQIRFGSQSAAPGTESMHGLEVTAPEGVSGLVDVTIAFETGTQVTFGKFEFSEQ